MNWASSRAALLVAASAAAAATAFAGCAPRPRMCTASSECTTESACVAGRCQQGRPNVKPAVDAARRVVVRPVDLAYLRRGDGPSGGALPPLFALGRDSALLMMRFSVALPTTANVVEAYVVLRRSDAVDDDPTPISLHAAPIVDAWEGRSISWGLQPRAVEFRTPTTVVEPGGPSLVRMDVRELVRQWPKHDARDQGIAVVAENETRTGATFAFRSVGGGSLERASGSAGDVEPYLELYLR